MEDTQYGQAIVLDSSGSIGVPNRPYPIIDEHVAKLSVLPDKKQGWPTLQHMLASIRANAPEPKGLPEKCPNPNQIYRQDTGQIVRYVINSDETREHFVGVDGRVHERLRVTARLVSLTLEGARAAAQAGNKCDYWNGFTWVRDGYIPERDFPVMAQMASRGVDGGELVFDQPVSATSEAQIRHHVSAMDRARPTIPYEEADTIPGQVTASASVPFPTVDDDDSTDEGDPLADADLVGAVPRRGPGRPRKE